MKEIRTILIDDEPDSIGYMELLLSNHFPKIIIVGTFTSSTQALARMEKLQPHLVFLDIEMPELNGFELLKNIDEINLKVVFVTAYNQFALQAFKFNALDYLVKPVQLEELKEVIEKVDKFVPANSLQLSQAAENAKTGIITRIAVPAQNGVLFIDLAEIIFVEASNNYSFLYLADSRKIVISKTLKDVQDVLEASHFLRVHRQYIINLNKVKQFDRTDNIITMVNGAQIPISRNHKDQLMQKYGWL